MDSWCSFREHSGVTSMTRITLPRYVAAGAPNPTTGVTFNNLEEKLSEYIAENGYIPVELSRPKDAFFVDLSNVIGKLVSITETEVTVELTELGERMNIHDMLDDVIAFSYIADTDTKCVSYITSAYVFCRKVI